MFLILYYFVAIGYGLVVSQREPSKFHWVAICSGVCFPVFIGVALANVLRPYLKTSKDG
jgi:hypothetical protein